MTQRYSSRHAILLALIGGLAWAGIGTTFARGHMHVVSLTRKAGAYTISLKLLPPEPFTSVSEEHEPAKAGHMVNGGGAQPVEPNSAEHPNHHLVVFLTKDGKPVEHAEVSMSYRKRGLRRSKWVEVPVTRMWVAGKGEMTTHFGNNVHLAPGRYVVRVVVNHSARTEFHLRAR